MSETLEETRLQALAALRVLDTPHEERFDRLVRLAQQLFEVPMAAVSLVDEHRQFIKAEVGIGLTEVPRSESFCARTVDRADTTVFDDPSQHPELRANPWVTGDDGVRFYAGQPLRAPGGATVGALCIVDTQPRDISSVQLAMLRGIADLVEAELARTDELDRAAEVQRSLLPRRPPALAGYDVAGVCLPASAIGGDFYDWYPVDEALQVVLADVMGKGIPAAILAASVRSLMRGASRFNDVETAVNRVAWAIDADLTETSSFVTLFAARLDPLAHVMTYVDAGHGIAGIVSPDGSVRYLESDGLPLGAPTDGTWRSHQVSIGPGDTFIALSDGLLDLFDTLDEAREAARVTILRSASAQEVVDVVAAYSRTHAATDDATCVVIRREGER